VTPLAHAGHLPVSSSSFASFLPGSKSVCSSFGTKSMIQQKYIYIYICICICIHNFTYRCVYGSRVTSTMDRPGYKKDFKTHCRHDFSGSHGSGPTPFSTLCLSHGSLEILKLLCLEQSATDYVENLHMSTLQQMHIHTSKSPRATYKLLTLFEELSCRQLYLLKS